MKKPCPKCGIYANPLNVKCSSCGFEFPPLEKKSKQKSIYKNMTRCKDCGNHISKNAQTCPICGNPIKKKSGRAIFLLLMFLGIMWISYQDHIEDKKRAEKERAATIIAAAQQQRQSKLTEEQKKIEKAKKWAEREQKRIEREKRRVKEYELCKQTLQCWGDKHSLKATFASQDTIERHAKYQFKWTDGWMGSKMTRFRWLDRNALTVTYIGDQIQFQNGFGAWQNMIYYCDYDPINERVLKVSMRVGRLPQSK